MLVKFLKSIRASENGYEVKNFEHGKVLDIVDELAVQLLDMGYAEKFKEEIKQTKAPIKSQ